MHGWFAVSTMFVCLGCITCRIAELGFRYLVGLLYPDLFAVSTGFAIQYALVWIALADGLHNMVGLVLGTWMV